MPHIIFKLFNVFSPIIILSMNASIPGFRNIGINNLPKKNLETKIIFSDFDIFGNFFETKREIILLKHFIE